MPAVDLPAAERPVRQGRRGCLPALLRAHAEHLQRSRRRARPARRRRLRSQQLLRLPEPGRGGLRHRGHGGLRDGSGRPRPPRLPGRRQRAGHPLRRGHGRRARSCSWPPTATCGKRIPGTRPLRYCDFDLADGEVQEARYFKIEDGELYPCAPARTPTAKAPTSTPCEILNAATVEAQPSLLAAKIAVSLALLAYLLSTTDLAALQRPRPQRRHPAARRRGRGALRGDPGALHLALARCCCRPRATTRPLGHLSASYLVATFFNNFLPSNIGGDVIRVRDSSQLTGSTTTSLAVVAIDRILGFGALYVAGRGGLHHRRARPCARLAGARARAGRAGPGLRRCSPTSSSGRAPRAALMAASGLAALPWARERVRDRAGRRARVPRAAGRGLAGLRGQRRAAGARRLLLLHGGARRCASRCRCPPAS